MDQLFILTFIKRIAKHPLISGSTVLFVGSFIANIFNYIFNLVMGRMLSVPDYGLYTSLSSVFLLLAIFGGALSTVITRYAAKFSGSENENGIKALLHVSAKFIFVGSLIQLILSIVLLPVLNSFLHIDNSLYTLIIIFTIFFTFLLSVPTGFFQGKMRFTLLSSISISQPIIKVIAAVLIIYLGFGVLGPLVGLFLSAFIPVVILGVYLFNHYKKKNYSGKFDREQFKKDFFHSSVIFFLAGIGLAVIQNSDIILVRHFLKAHDAGLYAALSLMGKAIFYFTSPIALAFFPIIAYKKERNERLLHTVILAVGIVSLVSLSISFVYFFYPEFVLRIFFPAQEYKVLSKYLGIFAIYILLLSVATLFNSYYLSIGKKKVYLLTLIAGIAQVILISIFHESILQVIYVLLGISMLLLLAFIGYYIKHGKD